MKILSLAWKTSLVLFLSMLLPLAVLLALLHFQPSSLVPLVERGASFFLGRDLYLQELTRVSLGEDTSLEVRGLKLANATWADPEPMLSIGYLKLVVNLPSLWNEGSILLRQAEIKQLSLELVAPEGELPNWDLPLKLGDDEPEEEYDDVLFPVIIEQLHLAELRIGYLDVDRQLDINVEQLQKSLNGETGFSKLSLAGVVNELPLSGQGVVGPSEALQTGRNLELDMLLMLGNMQIEAAGSVADALALKGADLALTIRAPHSRPVLDLLGLHQVRDGPMSFEGRLADAAPGIRVEAEGEMAGFGLGAHGVIEKPRELDGIELAFYLDGPSMAEAGVFMGIDGFKDVPFDLSGELYRRGSTLKIENGQFRAAQGRVSLSGVLPAFPDIDDWQVDIEARQVDLSILGPLAGIEGLPQPVCDIDGHLFSDGKGVELMDFKITDGDLELLVSGVVGERPDYVDTALTMHFSGNDLTRLQALIGLETLPAEPYELAGELSHNSNGWRVEKAHLLLQGFRAEVTADLDSLVNPQQLDGRITVSSQDVPRALRSYGIELETIAPLPLQISSEVRLKDGGFELTGVEGIVGAANFSGSGWLSAAQGFAGSRVTLDSQAESMGEALAAFYDEGFPGQPFRLSLDATYHAPLISIDRLLASMGTHTMTGHLTLEGVGEHQLARGQLSLQGKSSQKLLQLLGLETGFVDGPYRASSGLELSAGHLVFESLSVDALNSDLGGELRLEFSETPTLDIDMHSREVHLPSLFPQLGPGQAAEPDAPETSESALMEPPTAKEIKQRMIPDTPLPLDWINSMNGHWRYSVDRAYERESVSSKVLLDIELNEGVLKTREVGWDGPFSKGWIDVVIDARQTPYNMGLQLASDRIPLLGLLTSKDLPEQKSTYRSSLRAAGTNVREAVASLDGALILRSSGAKLSNKGLDLILGDVVGAVFDRLNPATKTEKHTEVECMAGAARASNGVLRIEPGMVIRTDRVDIISRGAVDLRTEALNISFNTRSRKGIGISAGKAITPYLKVAGNLENPWLTVDPEAVAISGTAAIATAGVSILAESLYDRWVATSKNPCGEIFKKVRKDPDYEKLLAFRAPGLTGGEPPP